ncbi:hypothetical protein B0H67DRAFT_630674 [Lasiosphaeris hirsuta]|uniref:Uncharacterized protein n=1 Tax=Lasiosphaeris hirsuta TaxID=260670 RepID=A0AA40B9T3_9PEZI|nr:hypothetical protein B0H67DRAFT_630674 [Lasiosphaeris hirsuta]
MVIYGAGGGNLVANRLSVSYTDKAWAQDYPSIDNLIVRSTVDEEGMSDAVFDNAFLPACADGDRRLDEPAQPPMSNVVLAAWAKYPAVTQPCHTKPLSEVSISENVDSTYAMYAGNVRIPLVIGEMKRNLINAEAWQSGELPLAQKKLARELRGYGEHQSPQAFCWDGQTLLTLQFRALKPEQLRDAACAVDCWVIPSDGSTCTLRYAP